MKIELYTPTKVGADRLVFELPDGLQRILVKDEKVWGFDTEGKQHSGVLVHKDVDLRIIA